MVCRYLQMNVRVKALKRQLDETEEEVQREKVGKRKAQRELEDLLETHETITRECNNLRNKLRYADPALHLEPILPLNNGCVWNPHSGNITLGNVPKT